LNVKREKDGAFPLPACGERVRVRGVSKSTACGESPSPDRFAIDLSPYNGERRTEFAGKVIQPKITLL